MSAKSVKKKAISGAGIFKVGANTMPTFLTVILFEAALSTTSIRKEDIWRSSSKLAMGSLCTRTLKLWIFLLLSSMSADVSLVFLGSSS